MTAKKVEKLTIRRMFDPVGFDFKIFGRFGFAETDRTENRGMVREKSRIIPHGVTSYTSIELEHISAGFGTRSKNSVNLS